MKSFIFKPIIPSGVYTINDSNHLLDENKNYLIEVVIQKQKFYLVASAVFQFNSEISRHVESAKITVKLICETYHGNDEICVLEHIHDDTKKGNCDLKYVKNLIQKRIIPRIFLKTIEQKEMWIYLGSNRNK